MADVLDCDIGVSKFELQSHNCFSFRSNTPEKVVKISEKKLDNFYH